MRIASVAAGIVMCVLAGTAASPEESGAPSGGAAVRVESTGPEESGGLDTYVITSDYQETPCKLYVLLPGKFDAGKHYKVLYILPSWAPSNDGIAEAAKLGLADKHDVICVQPEFSGTPWYADNPDNPKARNDSYLPDVIVPFIDKTYPTIAAPEGRILVGFSKGGIGAVSLLLRHPDTFGRAGSWDAPLMEDRNRPEYYGPPENFMKNYYIPNLLAAAAHALAGRPARIAIAGNGWGGTARAHELMESLSIPHYVNESLQGAHEWTSGWLAPLVDVLMADDMTKAPAGDVSRQDALSLETSAPDAAGVVTIKGIMMSTWHFYRHVMTANQSPTGSGQKFDLVIYAFDGPPDVQAALHDVLADYPERGLDAAAAQALQERFDKRLLYYIDMGDPQAQDKMTLAYTWANTPAVVTGTVVEKDGKRWIMGAKVAVENRKQMSFKYPPDCMLAADKPFAASNEKPIDLKIAEGIHLRFVPIPPGTFIMGSPFYQMPRYQDECPHEVTLTKTFYFSETPVTQEMWEAVLGKDADRSRNRGPHFAVEDSPFPDIREFCRIVSETNGRKVRVPTAAELEYVARLGTSNPCFPPKYAPQRTDVANRKHCVPVKTGAPNAWGVYDLPAWGITATSDWKAPNRPDKQVDPQGEPFDSPWVYSDSAIVSVQKQDRPVANMIMKGPYPAVHKGASGLEWDRPNMHDRYSEDGLDGGNGTAWIGIVRLVVEAQPVDQK